jgi:flavin-dependent dehydrogenase
VVEVLIAGAGPAGAVAAIVLARAGVRVLMVDRARFPRPKLCGDTLNPGALAVLERLGLQPDPDGRGLRLRGMRVTSGRGVSITGCYRQHHALAITREIFDHLLVQAAARAGAHVEEGVRVVEPLVDETSGRPVVRGAVLDTPRGRVRMPAAWTIGADGRRSALALALRLSAHPIAPRRWAVGAYYAGVAGLEDVGEIHVRDGHYLGVAPLMGGLANVCVVTADDGRLARPHELLVNTLASDPLLRDRFASATRVSAIDCDGPLAVENRYCGLEGLLLAGDSAGFDDPMTGDGLRFALRGGLLAAEAVLRNYDRSTILPHRWLQTARTREFARKQRINRVLRRVVSVQSGISAAEVMAGMWPAAIRRIIRVAGDVPQ